MRKKEARGKKVGGEEAVTRTLGLGGGKDEIWINGRKGGEGEDLDTRRGSRNQWDITPTLETSAHESYPASIIRTPRATGRMVNSGIKDRPLFR